MAWPKLKKNIIFLEGRVSWPTLKEVGEKLR